MILDHKRFSPSELFSSPNGKTSMALLCAFLLIFTGCVGFVMGLVKHQSDVHITALGFASLGSTLLGIRRFTPDKEIKKDESI